jgi:hypothetical protein
METREVKGTRRPPSTRLEKPPILPVKTETTGHRDSTYFDWRRLSSGSSITIDWVEWRKSDLGDKLGEPAAIVKTIPLSGNAEELVRPWYESALAEFLSSKDLELWKVVARKLLVPASGRFEGGDLEMPARQNTASRPERKRDSISSSRPSGIGVVIYLSTWVYFHTLIHRRRFRLPILYEMNPHRIDAGCLHV